MATSNDTAHALAECSNRGTCDRSTGECRCSSGFEGHACERSACPGDCSGNGVCMSLRSFASSQGTTYSDPWDADKLFGCVCDETHEGHDCSVALCPYGRDPLDATGSLEVQVFHCDATGGTISFGLGGYYSDAVSVNATTDELAQALEAIPLVYEGGIAASLTSGATICSAGSSVALSVTFTRNFGDVDNLALSTSGLTGGSITAYYDGAVEPLTSTASVRGSVFQAQCSARGVCDDASGVCECVFPFVSSDGDGNPGTRGDCGAATAALTGCLTDSSGAECGGHGVCSGDPTYRCTCAEGFTGAACVLRTCPVGLSWFDAPSAASDAHNTLAECSDRGACDRATGECRCADGFEGAACERMSCPRSEWSATPCSGHGRCLSMRELAQAATDNGDPSTFEYGAVANDPLTWDADKVYGCACDDGWQGHDCSLRTCPVGHDPMVPGDAEVQLLVCTATSGTFRLSFRSVLGDVPCTDSLPTTASADDIKTALESLETIGTVDVSLIDTATSGGAASTACSAGGDTVISVRFVTDLGDVPNLKVDVSTLSGGSIAVYSDGSAYTANLYTVTSVAGTTVPEVCSNRGVCDTALGICNCFSGFGSSDGTNSPGSIPNCGAKQTVVKPDAGYLEQLLNRIRTASEAVSSVLTR